MYPIWTMARCPEGFGLELLRTGGADQFRRLGRPPTPVLTRHICYDPHAGSHMEPYGAPRVHAELKADGLSMLAGSGSRLG